jgi:hypothetical protein
MCRYAQSHVDRSAVLMDLWNYESVPISPSNSILPQLPHLAPERA